jgi:type IV pilus assembly protein PilM
VRAVLENGIREISGEVRNSLDFHRSQDEGGQVSHVVLSGAALDLPGFAEALQASLGFEVRSDAVGVADSGSAGEVSTSRLSVAAGLACEEAPR